MIFHHDTCNYHWEFYGHHHFLSYTLGFIYQSSSGSANTQLPGCFRPWAVSLIEHATFVLLYAMFIFPTRIFYRGVPGFVTDCRCGFWCRGLTTCLLCVGPLFGNLVQNDSMFVNLT